NDLNEYAPAPAPSRPAAAASGNGSTDPRAEDPRPIVPIESLFYSDHASPIEMAASLLDASISAMGALTGALGDLVANPLVSSDRAAPAENAIVPVEEL